VKLDGSTAGAAYTTVPEKQLNIPFFGKFLIEEKNKHCLS